MITKIMFSCSNLVNFFPSKLCVKLGGRSNKTQLDQFKIEMFRGEGKYTKLDKERET